MKKHFKRVFTISDWMDEENWLREQSKKGLKLVKLNPPIDFVFEETEPEDVVYKLDYKNTPAAKEYKQMYLDYGWEFCGSCFGWNYFRKPAKQVNMDKDGELFSDNESKLNMLEKIFKTRYYPLIVLFLCCIVPNLLNFSHRDSHSIFDLVIFGLLIILFFLYIYIIVYCGRKLKQIRKDLSN